MRSPVRLTGFAVFGTGTAARAGPPRGPDLVAEAITKLRRRFPSLTLNGEPTRLDDVIVNGYAAVPLTPGQVTPGPTSADPA